MASGSGWNICVWLAGGGCGWNLWVWLVGVVVRRYIDFLILLIPIPLHFFCSSIPTFCSFFKMFFVLVPVLFCMVQLPPAMKIIIFLCLLMKHIIQLPPAMKIIMFLRL